MRDFYRTVCVVAHLLNIRCESKNSTGEINSTEKALTGVYVVLVVNHATRFQSPMIRPWVNTQQIGHTAPKISQHCQHITCLRSRKPGDGWTPPPEAQASCARCLTIYQRENTTKNWESTTENRHIPPNRPQITRFAVDWSSIRCGKTTRSDEEIMFAEGCRVRVQTIGVASTLRTKDQRNTHPHNALDDHWLAAELHVAPSEDAVLHFADR